MLKMLVIKVLKREVELLKRKFKKLNFYDGKRRLRSEGDFVLFLVIDDFCVYELGYEVLFVEFLLRFER